MLTGWTIAAVGLAYLCILFAIAYWGDRRADQGRSIIANPYIYTLSIAVYCTSWTFYGSVGRASTAGVGFLPIYLGPTLVFILGWFVLRKIVRISKSNRITSIADFVASRYGKSALLGGLVSVIAVVGILPYISLQLIAVSTSFTVLLEYPDVFGAAGKANVPILADTALYASLILAMFAILFGTRHIDASEHHEGMVAAVAFESVVKLAAFLAIGVFVTYGMYDGFGDIFARAQASEKLSRLFTMDAAGGYGSWFSLTLLSMSSILFLPRQFQVAVVECVDEAHIKKAVWLFPLYLLCINIFVLPIAMGGLLHFPDGNVDADTFVLTLPMVQKQEALALLGFIGGLSASTAMIIVATVALSTMVSNDLVMPVLLRIQRLRLSERADLSALILAIRRSTIVLVVLLGYVYFRLIGGSYALVSIGLVSFAAAAQFAPAIIAGIFWKGASRAGAMAGLVAGFLLWTYTLLLPSFARSGWISESFLDQGPLGLTLLKPYALLGLEGFDPISHTLVWSMAANIGLLVFVSLMSRQSVIERSQAVLFVDVYRQTPGDRRILRGSARVGELRRLVARFIGEARMQGAFAVLQRDLGRSLGDDDLAGSDVVAFSERQLAGAIGAASARIMIASVVREELSDIDQMMEILDEASQVIEYSRQLEERTSELQIATDNLRAANTRLQELDKLKDGFVSTVSHELRTPLTSIRSFSEIIQDNPDISREELQEFAGIIVKESERLTRLIDNVLDIAKMEAGDVEWRFSIVDPADVIREALDATSGLFHRAEPIRLEADIAADLPQVHVDADRLVQVLVNLISNAVKFCDAHDGVVAVVARGVDGGLEVAVRDNGIGIAPEDHEKIFLRFQQVPHAEKGRPKGTGLGLPICVEIINRFGGKLWVESRLKAGAKFTFRIPAAVGEAGAARSPAAAQ
ncbi:MAG: sensor histidine kinase [Hyphomicrobiaceae bacterium]